MSTSTPCGTAARDFEFEYKKRKRSSDFGVSLPFFIASVDKGRHGFAGRKLPLDCVSSPRLTPVRLRRRPCQEQLPLPQNSFGPQRGPKGGMARLHPAGGLSPGKGNVPSVSGFTAYGWGQTRTGQTTPARPLGLSGACLPLSTEATAKISFFLTLLFPCPRGTIVTQKNL